MKQIHLTFFLFPSTCRTSLNTTTTSSHRKCQHTSNLAHGDRASFVMRAVDKRQPRPEKSLVELRHMASVNPSSISFFYSNIRFRIINTLNPFDLYKISRVSSTQTEDVTFPLFIGLTVPAWQMAIIFLMIGRGPDKGFQSLSFNRLR
jgi:hypothetical protein